MYQLINSGDRIPYPLEETNISHLRCSMVPVGQQVKESEKILTISESPNEQQIIQSYEDVRIIRYNWLSRNRYNDIYNFDRKHCKSEESKHLK